MALQLQIEGLSKTYANGVAAKDVSLAIPTGMFGLLGPNGAGKSTLMRTIATLQEPDTGTIRLDGIDVLQSSDEVRQLLGYLPQADFEPAEPDLEDREQDRADPLAFAREHLERAEVEVQVPQPTDVLGLVGAHLPALGGAARRSIACSFAGLLEQPLGLHEAA